MKLKTLKRPIEILNNNHIDLVIMDLGLPNINGIEATKKIRAKNKEIKVVILHLTTMKKKS